MIISNIVVPQERLSRNEINPVSGAAIDIAVFQVVNDSARRDMHKPCSFLNREDFREVILT